MPDEPSITLLSLVILAAGLIAAGLVVSCVMTRRTPLPAALSAGGIFVALLAQMLHSWQRADWLPLHDNFDALLWLGIIIGGLSLYLQGRGAVRRIDWIASPIVILLLAGAAVFGAARPHVYTNSLWLGTHLVSVFACPVAFALSACAGVLYLVLQRKLRSKDHQPVDSSFGSLEKLERLNYTAVTIGFAFFTIGVITGLVATVQHPNTLGPQWYLSPKVLLSFLTYAVYAVVLHSPINPTFRGRKTAILSIAGFVLMLGILVVVQR